MDLPPILEIRKRNKLRLKAAESTLPHLADEESRKLFLHHVKKRLSPTRMNVPTDASTLVPLRIKELNGQTIWCRSGLADLGVVYDTFVGRFHLPPDTQAPVRTILDLGANIGLTIADLAMQFPEARILGVEIDPGNCELCRKNIARFGDRCRLRQAAVWHEPGEILYGGERESGFAIGAGNGGAAERSAPAVTVAELIDDLEVDEVDYVKMDIEGAEKEVLAAADDWLPRVRSIKVEVHPEKASTLYTMGMCADHLERHGMRCEVDSRHHACIIGRRPAPPEAKTP